MSVDEHEYDESSKSKYEQKHNKITIHRKAQILDESRKYIHDHKYNM